MGVPSGVLPFRRGVARRDCLGQLSACCAQIYAEAHCPLQVRRLGCTMKNRLGPATWIILSEPMGKEVLVARMEGGCLCGSVRYSADAEPAFTGVCHCADCQRFSGSAFATVVAIPT